MWVDGDGSAFSVLGPPAVNFRQVDGDQGGWTSGGSLPAALENGKVVLFNSHANDWRAGAPLIAKRVIDSLGQLLTVSSHRGGLVDPLAWNRHQVARQEAP